jgi:hypothetical protein
LWRRSAWSKQRREERKEGEEEGLTGGAGVSLREKKRERDGRAWAAAGEGKVGCSAAGPKGKVVLSFFVFFSNSNFSFQIQTKILQTFHKILEIF